MCNIRVGRTARAGAKGTAITLVSNRSQYNELQDIQYYQKHDIKLFNSAGWELPKNIVLAPATQRPSFLSRDKDRGRNDFSRNNNGNSNWRKKDRY